MRPRISSTNCAPASVLSSGSGVTPPKAEFFEFNQPAAVAGVTKDLLSFAGHYSGKRRRNLFARGLHIGNRFGYKPPNSF